MIPWRGVFFFFFKNNRKRYVVASPALRIGFRVIDRVPVSPVQTAHPSSVGKGEKGEPYIGFIGSHDLGNQVGGGRQYCRLQRRADDRRHSHGDKWVE